MTKLYSNDHSSMLCIFIDDPEYQVRWQICDKAFVGVVEYIADENSTGLQMNSVTRFYKQTVE